jgi:hypothetical protein
VIKGASVLVVLTLNWAIALSGITTEVANEPLKSSDAPFAHTLFVTVSEDTFRVLKANTVNSKNNPINTKGTIVILFIFIA